MKVPIFERYTIAYLQSEKDTYSLFAEQINIESQQKSDRASKRSYCWYNKNQRRKEAIGFS